MSALQKDFSVSNHAETEDKSLLKYFEHFRINDVQGIEGWLNEKADPRIFERLKEIASAPLTCAGLNQLLTLGHQAPVSEGFFRFYWLNAPENHPYSIKFGEGGGMCQ